MGVAESALSMIEDQKTQGDDTRHFWQVFRQFMTTVDSFLDFINYHLETLNGIFFDSKFENPNISIPFPNLPPYLEQHIYLSSFRNIDIID